MPESSFVPPASTPTSSIFFSSLCIISLLPSLPHSHLHWFPPVPLYDECLSVIDSFHVQPRLRFNRLNILWSQDLVEPVDMLTFTLCLRATGFPFDPFTEEISFFPCSKEKGHFLLSQIIRFLSSGAIPPKALYFQRDVP